ncbi:PAS domain-containing protein [Halovenus sp. WSH3]|uniref:histidine kinase n=1 Tax=Halovenus carboxidivorans TaxID=2692199 RepID=A0A6B0TAF8_9EURY|nr:ATP-binding protein [Halovenus carboxidivorans]MXR52231.1 PAS domain-containing protein [Halovenus carboxidivorans]
MSSHLPFVAAVVYTLIGAVPAAVAAVSWRNRGTPGAAALVVTGLAAAAASIVQAGRFLDGPLGLSASVGIVLHIALLASVNVAVLGTLYVAAEYTNHTWLIRRWLLAVLAFAAVALPVGRIFAGAVDSQAFGTLANADFLYRVVVAVSGLVLFVRQYLGSQGVYRKQAGALSLGLALGAGFGLLERLYSDPFVEFTLLGMSGGCVVLGIALFRYEFLQTSPIARETLFDYVSDPVVAVDARTHVADANRAARDTFGIDDREIGQRAEAVFSTDEELTSSESVSAGAAAPVGGLVLDGRRHFDPSHPVIEALHRGDSLSETEFALVTEGGVSYYTVTSTALSAGPDAAGHLVVFREVTAERERAQDLDILKEVLSRVLRHNLRNEITVIRGFASSISDKGDEGTAAEAERIVDRTNVLLNTSETARAIKNVIDSTEPVPVSLGELVARAVETARDGHPGATVDVDVPDATVSINPEFDAALREVIENAIVHNDTSPHVEITGERIDGVVELRISDNGPGIPEYELDVLDRGEETSLDHGSGAGLWLIQIATEHSNGDCRFETGEDGTTVTIRLPVAESADRATL